MHSNILPTELEQLLNLANISLFPQYKFRVEVAQVQIRKN